MDIFDYYKRLATKQDNCEFSSHEKVELTCYGLECESCKRNKSIKNNEFEDKYKPLGTG